MVRVKLIPIELDCHLEPLHPEIVPLLQLIDTCQVVHGLRIGDIELDRLSVAVNGAFIFKLLGMLVPFNEPVVCILESEPLVEQLKLGLDHVSCDFGLVHASLAIE